MTVAIDHAPARRRRSEVSGGVEWRSRSFRLVAAGLIGLIAAAWGGIVAFVGPTFGFSADGTGSWYWGLGHSLLALIPGAAGCVAAITIMGFGLSRTKLFGLGLAGLLAAIAGAWFVVGPFAWPVLYSSHTYFVTASPLQALAHMIGYSLGPGLILAIVGGVAWGAAEDRSANVHQAVAGSGAAAPASVPEAPVAEPTASAAGVADPAVAPMDPVQGAGAGSTSAPRPAESVEPRPAESGRATAAESAPRHAESVEPRPAEPGRPTSAESAPTESAPAESAPAESTEPPRST